MQCMSCATELLHPANFCPVCGARLAAPPPDGSVATNPGGTTPAVTPVPPETSQPNVVYINEDVARSRGAIPANPHASDYGTGTPHPEPRRLGAEQQQADELRRRAAELQASLPAFGSHDPVTTPEELIPPPRVDDNPFGDFFGDGPTAWLVDEDDDERVVIDTPRVVGTAVAGGAILMLVAAWTVWGLAMYRGAGGAEAGGFLLLALLLWVRYLTLPRVRQHAAMLRWHVRVQRLVERRTEPLRERTEAQARRRRERDRYRAMADERARRVTALGEGAYRSFRQGTLPADLHPGAQRVLAIERQMLTQDQRIHQLERERGALPQGDGHGGTDAASPTPGSGHDGS
jgi:hypothetical protein